MGTDQPDDESALTSQAVEQTKTTFQLDQATDCDLQPNLNEPFPSEAYPTFHVHGTPPKKNLPSYRNVLRQTQDSRTPKPGGIACVLELAKRLGVRLSSAAFNGSEPWAIRH